MRLCFRRSIYHDVFEMGAPVLQVKVLQASACHKGPKHGLGLLVMPQKLHGIDFVLIAYSWKPIAAWITSPARFAGTSVVKSVAADPRGRVIWKPSQAESVSWLGQKN